MQVLQVVFRAAIDAARSVFGPKCGVRAHCGPGGRYARTVCGGPPPKSFAMRTRLHAATTY